MYTLRNIKVKLSQSQDVHDMVSGDDENNLDRVIGHRGEGNEREYQII